MAGKTTDQGYGWTHQQERERWRPDVEAGLVDCWRCMHRIESWQDWDLGHDDNDPTKRTYRGPEHRHCNRQAGGRKGLAMRGRRRWWTKPKREHAELSVDAGEL